MREAEVGAFPAVGLFGGDGWLEVVGTLPARVSRRAGLRPPVWAGPGTCSPPCTYPAPTCQRHLLGVPRPASPSCLAE